jgi:hypothetical protein
MGGGLTAGSICQGETLSGRGMEEASSHLTWMIQKYITTMFHKISLLQWKSEERSKTLR